MKLRKLILISILISIIPFALYSYSESNDIGDLGSLLGAFSGIIAVVWFYRGLRLQSLQIEEQRIQFSKQHHIQYQDSLISFLKTASDRTEKNHEELLTALGLSHSGQLSVIYINSMNYYKVALESTDPNEVLSQIQEWMRIEGPCVKFMSSIKDIIVLHKKRLNIVEVSEEKDVVDYVYINSSHLLQQPFMSSYQVSVKMLSEQMMHLTPGRKAMILASRVAMTLIAPEGVIKKDKILEDIESAKSENKLIPKICEMIC